MTQKTPLYEGKAKVIFEGSENGTLIQHFKDDATAFNAQKKDVISGKGILNNYISEHIMMAKKQAGQKIINPQCIFDNDFQLFRCGPAKSENMLWRDNRIAKTVVFQAKFNKGVAQH